MKETKKLKADYEELSLADDFMFCKIMVKPRNCIEMLKRLTGNKIERIKAVAEQKVIQVTSDSKGIRYDVYVEELKLFDGRKILFFNTKGTIKNISPEAEILLEYIEKKKVGDKYTEGLEKQVKMARMNKEWRVEYMKTYFHDIDVRDEGREEGMAQGIEQGKIIQLIELVRDGDLAIEVAIRKSNLSEEEFMKYLNGENNE